MGRFTFTADQKFMDAAESNVNFEAAPASKLALLEAGLDFYQASAAKQEEMLKADGSLFIRRALLTFANVAGRRYGERDVQKAAMEMRESIPARGGVGSPDPKARKVSKDEANAVLAHRKANKVAA